MAESVIIDRKKCTGCGICAAICPSRLLALVGGTLSLTSPICIECGHCEAVCPQQAIALTVPSPLPSYRSFRLDPKWLPYGEGDVSQLVRLMHSRRSCRKFTERRVKLALLEDLVRICTSAPSGTNSQAWFFSILESRAQVIRAGQGVADFFERLNGLARNPLFRLFDKLLGKGRLSDYYSKYYPGVADALNAWKRRQEDRLFHGAPAAIVVGAAVSASCPAEDAMLATQNMLLAAHAMGLGTCLIGYAVEAIRRDKLLRKLLKMKKGERVYAVIAVGYPAVHFGRLIGRRQPLPRFPLR